MPQLPAHERPDAGEGIEVVRHQLLVGDLDLELGFEERDELQDSGGIDDPPGDEGVVLVEGLRALAEQKVIGDELPDDRLDDDVNGIRLLMMVRV